MTADIPDALIEQAAKALCVHGCVHPTENDPCHVSGNIARLALEAVADEIRADALNEGRAKYAAVWDDGVDAAFRGAITRQNAADVKRGNPYRKAAS